MQTHHSDKVHEFAYIFEYLNCALVYFAAEPLYLYTVIICPLLDPPTPSDHHGYSDIFHEHGVVHCKSTRDSGNLTPHILFIFLVITSSSRGVKSILRYAFSCSSSSCGGECWTGFIKGSELLMDCGKEDFEIRYFSQ
jgi:hypothetical protein